MTDQPQRPTDGRYYADSGTVWKAPIHTPRSEGGITISIGFPVCRMTDTVGSDAAESVAVLMNRGDVFPQLVKALEDARADCNSGVEIIDRAMAIANQDMLK